MGKRARQLASDAGWGTAVLLLVVAVEGAWVWTQDAAGLRVDQHGPFAALFAVIRQLLPPILARVLLAYVAGGAVLGVAAGVLARAWSERTGARLRFVWAGQLVGLLALLVLGHAVARPALFDDVRLLRPLVVWAVDHGQPWHAQLLALAWLTATFVRVLVRYRAARSRLVRLAAVGLAATGLALLSGALPHRQGVKAPRVVLIGIDAFRPDRLRALGGTRDVAINLDALAREATVFSQAYTPIAQTEPAWRSLLTARWPVVNGVRYPLTSDAYRVELPTFPQALERAGVHTAFATDCSRFHFEDEASGFSVRLQPPRGALNFALEKLRFRALGLFADNALGSFLVPEFTDNRALAGIHDPMGYARRLAAQMVSELSGGKSLFAFHSTAAHFPGDPVFPHYRRFVDPARPLERRLRMQFSPIGSGEAAHVEGWGRADSEALYDELLSQSDAQVGILFDALKAQGLWDDTWVIVFSDHGESFHPDREALAGATPVHGARLSEEENRILLLVKPPGRRATERVDAMVRLVDLGPTVLAALGVDGLPNADGVSLLPLLRGEAMPTQPLYLETGFTHASPAAFDPEHLARAPRTFDAYTVRDDGRVEMTAAAHAQVIAEKDDGAFDGHDWLVSSPRSDGKVVERCTGNCDALRGFLQRAREERP